MSITIERSLASTSVTRLTRSQSSNCIMKEQLNDDSKLQHSAVPSSIKCIQSNVSFTSQSKVN
jgi:hypothetical protein